jgi:cyclase
MEEKTTMDWRPRQKELNKLLDKHLIKGLMIDQIDAVATANLFNFIGNGLPDARSGILFNNGNLAQWQ